MPSLAVEELFKLAEMVPQGPISWNQRITESLPGVYVISIDDPASVQVSDLPEIEREYWAADQPIIYIGRATSLSRRMSQFYRHKYGAKSPHRGGQAILKIDSPKRVHYAVVDNFADTEDRLLRIFEAHVGQKPFGNRVRSARMNGKSG
jgi:hypothetical protein